MKWCQYIFPQYEKEDRIRMEFSCWQCTGISCPHWSKSSHNSLITVSWIGPLLVLSWPPKENHVSKATPVGLQDPLYYMNDAFIFSYCYYWDQFQVQWITSRTICRRKSRTNSSCWCVTGDEGGLLPIIVTSQPYSSAFCMLVILPKSQEKCRGWCICYCLV